ncbi:hypothetical protein D3C77_752370 [compost metagenome]
MVGNQAEGIDTDEGADIEHGNEAGHHAYVQPALLHQVGRQPGAGAPETDDRTGGGEGAD